MASARAKKNGEGPVQTWWIGSALLALGLLYAWLYGILGPAIDFPSVPRRFLTYPWIFALYLSAVGMVCRKRASSRSTRADLPIILLGAGALRIIVLAGSVPHNPDLGRYLWEGKVLLSGRNPYAAPPQDEVYDALREEQEAQGDYLYSGIWTDYADVRSVYGPLATTLFTIPHQLPFDRYVTLRAMMTGFDFLTVLLLVGLAHTLGRPKTWVIVYAWSPVCLNGFADRGQIDAVMVGLTVLAVWLALERRPVLAGMAFAGAILTKVSPLFLLFPLLRWGKWRLGGAFVATVLAGLLPYADAGGAGFQGFLAFADRWHQNDSVFSLVLWALGPLETWLNAERSARLVVTAAALTYALLRSRRVREDDPFGLVEALINISAAIILLSPVTFPWYTTTLLAFLCFRPRASLLALSAVPLCWYLRFLDAAPDSAWRLIEAAEERWRQPWRLPAYGMVAGLFLGEVLAARRRKRCETTAPPS